MAALRPEVLAPAATEVRAPDAPSGREPEVTFSTASSPTAAPEAGDPPVQGLSMGSGARWDFGGARRRLFHLSQGTHAGMHQVLMAALSELTEDLNRRFPSSRAESCLLSRQPECSPPDDELQQFLSHKHAVLAQVLGDRRVWVQAEQGAWRARFEP